MRSRPDLSFAFDSASVGSSPVTAEVRSGTQTLHLLGYRLYHVLTSCSVLAAGLVRFGRIMAAFRVQDQPMLTSTESVRKDEEFEDEPYRSLEMVQEIVIVNKRKVGLLEKLESYEAELQRRRAESARLREKYKNYIKVPQVDINYEEPGSQERGDLIQGWFTISQKPSMCIKGGQVLITFDEEKVASRIQKTSEFHVPCECGTLTAKPQKINLPVVAYEVQLDIPKRDLQLSNVISSMEDERIKDRLTISFSRPSKGGGEVENVVYDRNTGNGLITFLHPGVALSLAQAGIFQVDLEAEKMVEVAPAFQYRLQRFQTFCGFPRRTVLMSGIKDLDEEDILKESLEVFFQKPSNSGGEIAHIRYISKKKSLHAFFSCDDVAVVDNTSGI
ncbi:N-myc-interactor isoform X2 [Takifugu rubripes]|uniref:N-myc-interactor isoform X2 n=1 Tax=Takifugu rubripes TaxID=31033 RepID=UPI001146001B|nr:N-myc-interactor-like isoform X2 [Takifugu rubripes]